MTVQNQTGKDVTPRRPFRQPAQQDAKLLGLTTGAEYVGTGMFHEHFSESLDGGAATFTSVENFKIVGKGKAPTYIYDAVVHTTINANGDVTAEVSLMNEECTKPDRNQHRTR